MKLVIAEIIVFSLIIKGIDINNLSLQF